MSLVLEVISVLLRVAVGFWPVGLLLGFKLAFGRDARLGYRLRCLVQNAALAWTILAVAWLLLTSAGFRPLQVIPEPGNTLAFLGSGLVFLPLWGWLTWRSRQKICLAGLVVGGMEDLLGLAPAEFESLSAEMFRRLGFRVKVVAARGDHGIDLLIDDGAGGRWAVQCKRWKGKVGEPVVRDFYGALLDAGVDGGIVIAAGGFTARAEDWVAEKPISLWDGETLMAQLRKSQRTGAPAIHALEV